MFVAVLFIQMTVQIYFDLVVFLATDLLLFIDLFLLFILVKIVIVLNQEQLAEFWFYIFVLIHSIYLCLFEFQITFESFKLFDSI